MMAEEDATLKKGEDKVAHLENNNKNNK